MSQIEKKVFEEKINLAIELLRENGYVVKKITQEMIKDSGECDESNCTKDCFECSCSVCIMQQKGAGTLKNPKNPTRRQKALIKYLGLNVENWLVTKDTPELLAIVHRLSGQIKTYTKKGGERYANSI